MMLTSSHIIRRRSTTISGGTARSSNNRIVELLSSRLLMTDELLVADGGVVGERRRRFRSSSNSYCRDHDNAIFFRSSSSSSDYCSCNSNNNGIRKNNYSSYGGDNNINNYSSLLIRNISSSRSATAAAAAFFSTSAAAPARRRSGEEIQIPPNLHIDPRSSFAPVVAMNSSTTMESYDDDNDTNDDEQQGDDEEEEDDEIANDEYDLDEDGDDDERWTIPEPDDIRYAIPLPDRLHVSVHTLFGLVAAAVPDEQQHSPSSSSSEVGTIWLNDKIFGCNPIRVDLLKRSVNYIRNRMRGRRTAKTKTISEVSGSGRKIRQQKGTGMARAGHSRPPHFRGGAKAHGPKNATDYGNTKLNKKVKKQALCHALSQKLLEGNLIVLNELHPLPTHKTKELAKLLEAWEIGGRYGTTALILDHYYPSKNEDTDEKATSYRGVPINLWVASNNLYKIKVGNDLQGLNVYDVLKYEKLVLTLEALLQIEKRLENVYY